MGRMIAEKAGICIAVAGALIFGIAPAQGQRALVEGAGRPDSKPAAVAYLSPQQVIVPAGKPVKVALHFRVAPGMHINSHTPDKEGLIPTTFSITEGAGVRLDGTVYPPGAVYLLPHDSKTRLSVYSGEFIIQARIVAAAGDHLIEAKLRYQACDTSECMPPRTIPVAMDVIGK